MDVRCGRCGTEYDFDDALVSERGTTVKCTNCGHQFKVYPGGGGGAPERWIVRKASGRELVYTSLRDLQRAIAQRQVGPTDLLSRGGGQGLRPLGSIAELEPFFTAQGPAPAATAPAGEQVQRTLLGVAPSNPNTENTVRDKSGALAAAAFGTAKTAAGGVGGPPPPPAGGTASGGFKAPAAQQNGAARGAPLPVPPEQEERTVPRNPVPDRPARAIEAPTQPSADVELNAPTATNDGMSAAFRNYQDSFSDESAPEYAVKPRSSALRWVIGLVIASGLAFVCGTLGVRYVRQLSSNQTSATTAQDERVKKLLDQGDEELSRGDYETAKEQFDKASALAENHPAVLSALARLEATRADSHWLALKVIDPTDIAAADAEKALLQKRLTRVQKAAEDAARLSPNDPAVLRVRIDALRLGGDVAKARELVSALGADASQPETAYVLAALDMAEPSPAWPSVIDRLRTAASGERGPGRARAALVYALGASHEIDQAKVELTKLDAGANTQIAHLLHGFLDRAAVPAGSASAAGKPVPVAALPPATPVAASDTAPRTPDFRKLLEDASAAKRSGDLGRAEALYRAAQDQHPGNIEAIAGLGDVARARGDTATAAAYYDTALRTSPTYLPALIASADIKWSAGDKAGAVTLYNRVTNQAGPDSAYGMRAAQRIAEAQGSTGSTSPPVPEKVELKEEEEPSPSRAPPPPAPKPPGDTPTNIDTTDLPGFK
jgi:predicted Zn finger-like uncharacterized protein